MEKQTDGENGYAVQSGGPAGINMCIQAVMEYKYPMCFWNDSCEFLSSGLTQLVSMKYILRRGEGRTLPT